MILETAFFFWPIQSIQASGGWVYGTYATLHAVTHRQLLETGRLRWRRRQKAAITKPTEAQVKNSFLGHENLGSALETKGILHETYILDEQRYTQPMIQVPEEKANRALQDFLNLEDRSTDDAVGYIRKYGDFDFFELTGDGFVYPNVPTKIKKFCKKCGQEGQDPFAVALDDFWSVRSDIVGLWNLGSAVAKEDVEEVQAKCLERRPRSIFKGNPDWLAVGKAILCADLSTSLNAGKRNPRIILSGHDGRFGALTACTTVRTALYLMLLKMIVSGTEYEQCANCGKHFVVTVRGKKFCSAACQNVAKVRRWRDQQKRDACFPAAKTRKREHLAKSPEITTPMK